MKPELIPAYDREDEIIKLFTEYTDMLVKTDPVFAQYLDLQGYGDEVRAAMQPDEPPEAEAVSLYRSLGFYDTECYNDSPVETTLFMKLDL